MSNHITPLGVARYKVHYRKACGRVLAVDMEVENNSMSITNLVYDFYKLHHNCNCKIVDYIKITTNEQRQQKTQNQDFPRPTCTSAPDEL